MIDAFLFFPFRPFSRKIPVLALLLFATPGGRLAAQSEILTVPLIAADYYGWAYTEAFEDRANVFAWSTAGVDALGWSVFFAGRDADAGLKLVNLAGWAKTAYPVATLIWVSDSTVRIRAWIAAGTHAATCTNTLEANSPVCVALGRAASGGGTNPSAFGPPEPGDAAFGEE